MLEKMKALDEAEGGTLVARQQSDPASVFLKDGNSRHPHDRPLILVGGSAGTLKPGRRVRAPKEAPMCNLPVVMSERMGGDRALRRQ